MKRLSMALAVILIIFCSTFSLSACQNNDFGFCNNSTHCEACRGYGRILCEACNGDGYCEMTGFYNGMEVTVRVVCEDCEGEGSDLCPECNKVYYFFKSLLEKINQTD